MKVKPSFWRTSSGLKNKANKKPAWKQQQARSSALKSEWMFCTVIPFGFQRTVRRYITGDTCKCPLYVHLWTHQIPDVSIACKTHVCGDIYKGIQRITEFLQSHCELSHHGTELWSAVKLQRGFNVLKNKIRISTASKHQIHIQFTQSIHSIHIKF
jgi:hypothetical protein